MSPTYKIGLLLGRLRVRIDARDDDMAAAIRADYLGQQGEAVRYQALAARSEATIAFIIGEMARAVQERADEEAEILTLPPQRERTLLELVR